MEALSIILPALISVSVLYLLNKTFNYKDKLVRAFGTIKYKVALLIITLIVFFIITYKYDISIVRSPIGLSVFWSYFYLINVPNKPR